MDRYFIPNVAGIGDWVMRTAIVRDILIAHPDIEMYSSNRIIHGRNPDVKLCKKRKAINKFGAKRLAMRYYPGVIRTRNDAGYENYYNLMRKFVENQIGVDIPETHPHATLSMFDEEKPRPLSVPLGKYWVMMCQAKTEYKTWGRDNFQKLIDIIGKDVQIVSVGAKVTDQSNIKGVIDLRGKTTLSEAFSIVHHSSGMLSNVGLGTHLGGCLPTVEGKYDRPIVTIIGGKEHPDRLPYPYMKGFHSVGKLDCCMTSDCYRHKQFGCARPNQGLVKDCWNLIDPREVANYIGELL